MKRLDVLIIMGVLVAAAVLYFSGILRPSDVGTTAIITIDGREVARLPLEEDASYTTPDGGNRIVIQDGFAFMEEADCPDLRCVKQGSIHLAGETIVCLPHKVVVEIVGGEESPVDVIAK